MAGFLTCGQKHLGQIIALRLGVDNQRPVGSVQAVRPGAVAFRPPEIGQDILPGPSFASQLTPVIEVRGMAAQIDHVVDRAGAADGAAAREIDLPVVKFGLRRGSKSPIVLCVDQGPEFCRRANAGIAGRPAGFKQQNRQIRIFRESGRNDTPGRARADHNEIKFLSHARNVADVLPLA